MRKWGGGREVETGKEGRNGKVCSTEEKGVKGRGREEVKVHVKKGRERYEGPEGRGREETRQA